MKTIAEKFKYYANHPDYVPDKGMCRLLEDEGEEELLHEIRKYMKELGSSDSAYLQTIVDTEGWYITSKEIYLDWDNRPRIEDADSFAVGDEVIYREVRGRVIRLKDPNLHFPVVVDFGEFPLVTFTHNGRYLANLPRELKHV